MRLDQYLVKLNMFYSRNKAKEAIERGEVFVDGVKELKSAKIVSENVNIEIKQSKKFVSLGGYKLDKAIFEFDFQINGLVVADIGASTGGFTDCLLQNGAKKVYSVDLNDTLLHQTLKNDVRVVPIIKNAKELKKSDFDDEIDLLTADLSFISATSVLKQLSEIVKNNGYVILLIKPQFETGERIKFKNGIIRDKKYRVAACKNIYDFSIDCGLTPLKITRAPNSEDKNVEFLLLLGKFKNDIMPFSEVEKFC